MMQLILLPNQSLVLDDLKQHLNFSNHIISSRELPSGAQVWLGGNKA